MRTKEQIREYNRLAQIARRSAPPHGFCACGQPAAHWTNNYEPECARCRHLETPLMRYSILGGPEKFKFAEADKVKPEPIFQRFCVSIQEFANSILVHAHGDYILKIQ